MFCRFCGTENDDAYHHCKKCGKPLGFVQKQQEEKSIAVLGQPKKETFGIHGGERIECPFCGADSQRCQPIAKADAQFITGFNFWTGCCGFLLLGPFGALCGSCGGSSAKNNSATYWVCNQCGKEFMSKQSAISNAEKAVGASMAYSFFLALSIPFLWEISGMIWPIIIFAMLIFGFWASIPMTITEVTGRELGKLLSQQERQELYQKLIACSVISIAAGLILGILVVPK